MVTTPQHCRKYWFVFYYWYYISRCVYGQFSWQFIVLLPLTNRFSHFMPSACMTYQLLIFRFLRPHLWDMNIWTSNWPIILSIFLCVNDNKSLSQKFTLHSRFAMPFQKLLTSGSRTTSAHICTSRKETQA